LKLQSKEVMIVESKLYIFAAKAAIYFKVLGAQKGRSMGKGRGPVVDAEYLKETEGARRDLRALISSKQCAPIMLRLAYSFPHLSPLSHQSLL